MSGKSSNTTTSAIVSKITDENKPHKVNPSAHVVKV